MRRLRSEFLLAVITALALSACALSPQHDSETNPSAPEASANEPNGAITGLRLAEARCSGCHAVTPGQISPNSEAPPFASIARRSGLSQSSASRWLRQSHNFPDQMSFYLDSDEAEQLAAYLWTLREAE